MSRWYSWPGAALGVMVELADVAQGKKNPWCTAVGHAWTWKSDVVACSRPKCRETHMRATQAIWEGLDSWEGQMMLARELRR